MTADIPRRFIFIFGLQKQRQPFHISHYLCIESCYQVNMPEQIAFYYHHEPFGPYWELAKQRVTTVHLDSIRRISPVQYGLKNRAGWKYRYAHQTDFLRLELLLESGGVYADIDTLFVQPFPEALWQKPFVLGREGDIIDQETGRERHSLCNALIMSKPGAAFARLWLEQMESSFNGSWSGHSTLLPYELSCVHPDLVHIEPARSFYKHLWTREGLETLLQGLDDDFQDVYSMHLWQHLWWSPERRDFSPFHAGMLTESYIRQVDTTYNIVARKYLP